MAKLVEKFPKVLYASWDGPEHDRFLSTSESLSDVVSKDDDEVVACYALSSIVTARNETVVVETKLPPKK